MQPFDRYHGHKLLNLFQKGHRLVGLVVKASASRAGRSRVRIPLAPGFFWGRVIPVTSKLALQWLPCQAPGVIGSALGLVGPVSVYCDWVRWKVGSAASISVWQHVQLSEQIRPWDTLACCWDVKQPTNKQTKRDSILQLRTSNSLADYQLPCPSLIYIFKPSSSEAYPADRCVITPYTKMVIIVLFWVMKFLLPQVVWDWWVRFCVMTR